MPEMRLCKLTYPVPTDLSLRKGNVLIISWEISSSCCFVGYLEKKKLKACEKIKQMASLCPKCASLILIFDLPHLCQYCISSLFSPISLKAVVPVFHPFLLEVVHIHLGLPYRLSSKYLIEWFRATYHGCFNFIVQTP